MGFLDVLGYRDMLKSDMQTGQTEFLDKLRAAFDVVGNIDRGQFGVRSISDSIFILANNDRPQNFLQLLTLLKTISVAFIEKGLLIRGGVAFERHYENDRITYSVALAEAYALEQSSALFPRIVIHETIIDKAKNENWFDQIKDSGLVVLDGAIYQLHFIDDQNWSTLRTQFECIANDSSIDTCKNTSVRLKHLWLQDYLFNFKPSNKRSAHYLKKFKAID